MAKRLRVRRSSVVAVVAVGVLVAVGCGGSSDTKEKDGAGGNTGDGTAGSGGSNAGGGSKASGGKSATGGKDGGGGSASGGSGQAGGGQEQAGGSAAESGGASPGGAGTATGGAGDESGGAADGGTGGSGAATGGTASQAGASQGTGGFVLPAPEVGTVGTACSEPGALSCAGTHQRVVVTCNGDGEWEAFETCPVGQYCDTRAGETLGSCQEPVAECVDKQPAELICKGNDVHACGVDALTTEFVEDCPELCSGGQCSSYDSCPDGTDWINCSQDCTGKSYQCEETELGFTRYLGDLSSVAVIRTPTAANVFACATSGRRIFLIVDTRETRTEDLRFTVRAPWALYVGHWLDACQEQSSSVCGVLEASGDGPAIAMTDDEDALSTNVVVEHLPADSGEGCP